MAAKLVVEEGNLKGLSLPLEGTENWTIGSSEEECGLVIQGEGLSPKQLLLYKTAEEIYGKNLHPEFPVFLNDEETGIDPFLLQNGDTLKIGSELLRFYEDSSAHIFSGEEEIELPQDEPEELEEIEHSETEANLVSNETPGELFHEALHETLHEPILQENPAKEGFPVDQVENEVEEAEEEDHPVDDLAEIDFHVIETGRWLMKLVGGPNNGAEFYMQTGSSYVLGTDTKTCDIVFHDTSVSRQHAKITITPEDTLFIEDLKSRNGILIDGKPLEQKGPITLGSLITLGTTSFVVYDREGAMQTIISPLLPSIAKYLQQESATEQAGSAALAEASLGEKDLENQESDKKKETAESVHEEQGGQASVQEKNYTPYIFVGVIAAIFIFAAIGTSTLFKEELVVTHVQENGDELIHQALVQFPNVRSTFNKVNGSLFLLGHVSTAADKNQLLYNLQNLKFVKSIDYSGVVIDQYVVNEANSLLTNNPAWGNIRISSPAAGQFILTGNLQTRKQAEQLSHYLGLHFQYLDMLKKQVVVEEDVVSQISSWLRDVAITDVTPKATNGEVSLTGTVGPEQEDAFKEIVTKIKQIPGIRIVTNLVLVQTPETGIINLSSHYPVTGKSKSNNKFTVIINGRILSEGSDLDGMTITSITANQILLEKDKDKFRIDY